MNTAKEMTLLQWSDALASARPTPGGGGVGALLGTLATCLASMVANLTYDKKGYENFSAECNNLILKASEIQKKLLNLIDEDAIAFDNLMAAYKYGAKDEDYVKAAKPSVHMVYEIISTIDILEILGSNGNKNLISDVGVGATCAKAALETCKLNILVNFKYIKAEENKRSFFPLLEELIPESIKTADIIYKSVVSSLT